MWTLEWRQIVNKCTNYSEMHCWNQESQQKKGWWYKNPLKFISGIFDVNAVYTQTVLITSAIKKGLIALYRVDHEKVARLPFAFAFGCCIHFCIYAMLRTQATFTWPTLYTWDIRPTARRGRIALVSAQSQYIHPILSPNERNKLSATDCRSNPNNRKWAKKSCPQSHNKMTPMTTDL